MTSEPKPKPESSPSRAEAFQELDRRDEDQILQEIRGQLVEEFVYRINVQGKPVTNLSYSGVKEAVRRRGNVEILDISVTESESEFRALVKVRDLTNRVDFLGGSTAEKAKPFAYVLALNKAERNAYAKILPAKWIAALIEDWLKKHNEPSSTQGAGISQGSQSPTPQARAWEPRVPLSKEPLSQEGLKQIPLAQGLQAVGMVNVLEDEASIVPESSIYAGDPSLTNFLFPRVLDPLFQKYGLEYQVIEGEGGLLKAIVLKGKLDDSQLKELASAARWAFLKAAERNQGAGT